MKKIIIISLLALFCASSVAFSSDYKFEFTTVSDIVKKVKAVFGDIDSYSAKFCNNC